MNNKTRIQRIVVAALLAAAFAGSGIATAGTAFGAGGGLSIWLAAALAAAVCGLSAHSAAGAVAGAALLAVTAGGWAVTHMTGLRAIPGVFEALRDAEAAAPDFAGAHALLLCAALIFGALFFVMLYKRGGTSMAIVILAAMLVFSHGMSQDASIAASVPGLVAGVAAFALSGGVQRDHMASRVLLPSVLAVLAALLLMPGGRVTWRPMENLAERVRGVFEQYFNFTHERVAFSIAEEGYNHGGEIDGQPVAMLGGPANPDPNPVMRVESDGPVLLRGTIRSAYTGYSWVDITPKNRYLYYDITHRNVRERIFNLNFDSPEEAFQAVRASVELIDPGTSTLFVPGRMTDFSMELSSAVYYNSSGEMFMARKAEPGDRYAVAALNPIYGDELRQAVVWGAAEDDGQYAGILAGHTQLPEGVEPELYALVMELTAGAQDPYARASAIADYLRANMRYSLEVDYPPRGRDFVSWFVLESRTGYCSYFASAMAVMGRIAGLPTRYVEGYYARPGADGAATLTGMDAHAWAEVYFEGLGWIPFDATNGGPASGGAPEPGESEYGGGANAPEDEPETTASPFDDPSRPADGIADADGQAGLNDNSRKEPTPSPEPEGHSFDEPDGGPDGGADESADPPADQPDGEPDARRGGFGAILAILLILLLLALIAWWVRRRLLAADPAALCRQTRRASQGAMIVYRASLTLLAHMGQYPQTGESPEAFARRVSKELDNPDFETFTRAVTLGRYGGKPIRRDDVEAGLRAYKRFEGGMRRAERARFALTRIFRGLGDFEQIP